MSCNAQLTNVEIFIDKKHFRALVEKVGDSEKIRKAFGVSSPPWNSLEVADTVEGIQDIFDEIGFTPYFGDKGDIENLGQSYSKLIAQEEFLQEIAEFCKVGNFLEFSGEDRELWRWYVNSDNKLEDDTPVWLSEPEEKSLEMAAINKLIQSQETLTKEIHKLKLMSLYIAKIVSATCNERLDTLFNKGELKKLLEAELKEKM